MKRVLTLTLALLFVLAACSGGAADTVPTDTAPPAAATAEATIAPSAEATIVPSAEAAAPTPTHKTVKFRDMDTAAFLAEIGPGYAADGGIGNLDPTITYDPYQSIPVWFYFIVQPSNQDWRYLLHAGESRTISYSLKNLDGTDVTEIDMLTAVVSNQAATAKIEITNARIELPNETIPLDDANGIFEQTYPAVTEFDDPHGAPYHFAGLYNSRDTNTVKLPGNDVLRQGTFKADITLISSQGANKADYYTNLSGNPPLPTAEWFKYLKSQGFNSVRFQVSWFNHTNDETYVVDREWLDKVEETVNLALEQGLYCSINMGADMFPGGYGNFFAAGFSDELKADMPNDGNSWLTLDGDPKIEERFAAVWKQIAEHFSEYDEHLIFESMNEPNTGAYMDPENTDWYTNFNGKDTPTGKPTLGQKVADNLNRLNQIFVDNVRSVGGNSAKRFLYVPPIFNKGIDVSLEKFVLPTDPANHTIVAINRYLGDEAYGGGEVFPSIDKYLVSKGIGVVFTEFGSFEHEEFGSFENEFPYDERLAFSRENTANAKERNIPIMWFAANYGHEAGHPLENSASSCLYNPFTFEPLFPELIEILTGQA
ncbi:MAG: glycoside hydrolase family 5 protein [Oscillospiraceae bacterium]|jgi:aryl-phospho-beta-D-glucosidase BglC (GH1 family)|nr:glycoside hydrolase family 5 protein [Oscillospiraceae bacterium]